MSRRGLSRNVKRIPPSAEAIDRYLHLWSAPEAREAPDGGLPRFDPETLLGREAPLELEVGCGTGEFLNALAAERPEVGFVGVDPSTKSLFLAVREAADLGLENVRYVRAPVSATYPHLVRGALAAVYVHFPDPFARARGEHRVLNPRFLAEMHAALRPGGLLSVVSDKAPLFREALALAEEAGGWERTHAEPYLVGYEPPVRSRYQRKWERFGISALRFEMRRVDGDAGPG